MDKDILSELHNLRSLLAPDPLGGYYSLDPDRTSSAIIEEILDLEEQLLETRRSFKDGGEVLNRRMFTKPIRAAEGVYVPTLEDILQFYEGGFDASGQPIDQEALAQATELATILGTPANKDNSQFILDPVMAEKYKALGANVIPDGLGAFKFGENLSGTAERSPVPFMQDGKLDINNIPEEGVKIDENLTVFNSENLPAELQTEVDQKNKIEDEYAQRQLDIANQKELFQNLKNTGIKNLAGDTTQPITGDENIEIIKRNIMQGTNLVERGTPEYEALSATDKMKIDDQTSQFKRQEVDLTDVSEKGMQNIIDAAGSSAETAMMIYNDMLNAGGEVAEMAGEMLEGWKKAYTKGFDEDQIKSLNDQLDYLKEKSSGVDPDKLGPPPFGVDMETLKKGVENMNNWYKGTILPEIVEGGVDIIQSVFGAKDMGDGTLPAEQQTGTVASTIDPQLQSGISEEQDKAIDKADRPPSIVEDVTFKTKVDETKNKVIETVDEVKETVIEKFPEIKDKVTEKINILQEKLKNNTLTFEEYKEKFNELKDTVVSEITDLDIKNKVVDLFDETVKKTKDFFTKKEPPSELDNITAGVSEEGDKKVDLAGRADVETPIKDEEVKEIDETITADKDTVTSGSEGAGTVAANESAGSGSGAFTDGSMNVQNMIEETAKQTGYNFKGLDDTKDDLALKTMMYGLKLFLTPGSFSEAAGKVAQEALTNEINQRYKTKAAQAKFRGEMFKTILAGKLDIEKELAKLRGKKTDFKTYTYDDKMLNASVGSWIRNNLGIDVQLEFDGLPPKGDTEAGAAYLFATKFKQEVQKIGNNRKTEGTEDPSIDDELLIEAYNNISGDFKANKAELSAINKIFNYVTGKSDAEIEAERIEKGSLSTSDEYKRKLADATNAKIITEPMIQAAIDNNPNLSLTREDVIKAMKNDPTFSTWDYTRVT